MSIVTKRHKAVIKKKCDICDLKFELGDSFERITTHSKRKILLHTDCIKGW